MKSLVCFILLLCGSISSNVNASGNDLQINVDAGVTIGKKFGVDGILQMQQKINENVSFKTSLKVDDGNFALNGGLCFSTKNEDDLKYGCSILGCVTNKSLDVQIEVFGQLDPIWTITLVLSIPTDKVSDIFLSSLKLESSFASFEFCLKRDKKAVVNGNMIFNNGMRIGASFDFDKEFKLRAGGLKSFNLPNNMSIE